MSLSEIIWDYWSWFSSWVGAFWLVILIPISYFVLTRPFDKVVPRGFGPEYDLWFASVLICRPFSFAFKIVLPNYPNPVMKANWGDYNFRANASRFQIIFSYAYMCSIIFVGFVFTPSLLIHDFILN
jgi:hypothetical protein